MKRYPVIGLMSGTSLDGLDVAYCIFEKMTDGTWNYDIIYAETYAYESEFKERLAHVYNADALTFVETDVEFAKYMGECVNNFIKKFELSNVLLISSHGHTVFHRPDKGYTTQIGNGAVLAACTKQRVVCDFRSLDVALGGQGAPLVPIGDKLLFAEYDFCINLGGFANVSFEYTGVRTAFDICPFNLVLNKLFVESGYEGSFDKGGVLASTGSVHEKLLIALDSLAFYQMNFPKSLGREWLESAFYPVLNIFDISNTDKLHTISHHIAQQLCKVFGLAHGNKVLLTGGGAYNNFIVSLLKMFAPEMNIHVPDNKTVEFKEALVFGFLGLLRYLEEVNCLKSVTGAVRDSSVGCIYNPFSN